MEDARDGRQGTPIDVDESRDWDIGPVDIVLAVLTFPLLMWVLQYAFTGSERIVATRASRYRLYMVLVAVEVAIAAALVWWFTR
ncbi:MAG: hypothetical protein JWL76_2303 [Thermoleophilia bacterium]|nr:hypothetical protein [Thermoleophilia bacterium]